MHLIDEPKELSHLLIRNENVRITVEGGTVRARLSVCRINSSTSYEASPPFCRFFVVGLSREYHQHAKLIFVIDPHSRNVVRQIVPDGLQSHELLSEGVTL
jgi:hypothetical protein